MSRASTRQHASLRDPRASIPIETRTPVPSRGRRGRVVVVDDDPDQRALLAQVLTSAGFDVSTLHDGIELLDVLRMTPPRHFRMVVSDQRMPGLHGLEVLARSSSRRTPFVIVSGYDTPMLREQAAKFGVAAFVRKPIDVPEFLATIDRVLRDDAQRAPE